MPDDKIVDGPIRVKKWRPANYQDKFYGEVTLREAFAQVAQHRGGAALPEDGRQGGGQGAQRLGITSRAGQSQSRAVAGIKRVNHLIEMTGAYAVFANRGNGVWPRAASSHPRFNGAVVLSAWAMVRGPGGEPRRVEEMTDMMSV